MIRINIGCGTSPTDGWINFDNSLSLRLGKVPYLAELLQKIGLLERPQYDFIYYARTNRIQFGDATKGLPLPDGSVDVLYSSHMLEHLDQTEAIQFLSEAKRLLRTGGLIRIVVPDLRKQVQAYLDSNDAETFMVASHLTQPRPKTLSQRLKVILVGARNHLWMYDDESLSKLLLENGFSDPKVLPPGETTIADPGGLNLSERASESLYIEAKRP